MAKGLKGALESLKSAVGDLASLEVQTYTGSIDIKANGKLDDFEAFLKQGASAGTLSLVAVTKMNFDGDAINLVPSDKFPDHVRDIHDAAVLAGIETRQGLLDMFGDIIGLK